MGTAARYLTADAAPITRERTEEGYLLARAVVTTSGVAEYTRGELGLDGDAGGKVRVMRTARTLSHPDTLRSLRLRPVTVGHPHEWPPDGDAAQVGATGETVESDGAEISVSIALHGKDVVQRVEDGADEVSAGYTWSIEPAQDSAEYDFTTGSEPMVFNHVALVDRGRLRKARIMDSTEEHGMDEATRKEVGKMISEAISSLAETLKPPQEEEPAPEAKSTDAAPASAEEFEAAVRKEAARRAGILASAQAVLGADAYDAVKGKASSDILKAAIGDAAPEDESDDYLRGYLDAVAKEKRRAEPRLMRAQDAKAGEMDLNTEVLEPTKAYKDYVKSMDYRHQSNGARS